MKRVHPKTQTPLIATLLSGFLAAIMATIFDLHQLIDMMSIGTLLAYTIVAICVLVLHYDAPNAIDSIKAPNANTIIRQMTNFKYTKHPSILSSNITKVGVAIFTALIMVLCTLLLLDFSTGNLVAIAVVVAGLILTMWIIARQPKDDSVELSFKVPLVPLLPCLSIFMNLYLMFQLDINTWIRFIVWLIIGKIISNLFRVHLFFNFQFPQVTSFTSHMASKNLQKESSRVNQSSLRNLLYPLSRLRQFQIGLEPSVMNEIVLNKAL
jgi:solute carrier family 7 (cationic amino acid transporter), member 3